MTASLLTTQFGIMSDYWTNTLSSSCQFVLAVSRRSATSALTFDIFLYSALITAGIIVLILIALKTRHWILDNDESDGSGEAGGFFSISQLRELRDRGDISEEEYENAKRVLVAQGLSMLSQPSTDN